MIVPSGVLVEVIKIPKNKDIAKRITISLDHETLEWLNQKIAEKTYYNYQHATECALMSLRKKDA